MKRSTGRILTTHVGSVIRAARLLEFVRARLEAMAEGARIASKELWGRATRSVGHVAQGRS